MAKYSFKFKMMIVKEYCNGKAGYKVPITYNKFRKFN